MGRAVAERDRARVSPNGLHRSAVMAPTQGTTQGPRTAWLARGAGRARLGSPHGPMVRDRRAVSRGRPWSDHRTAACRSWRSGMGRQGGNSDRGDGRKRATLSFRHCQGSLALAPGLGSAEPSEEGGAPHTRVRFQAGGGRWPGARAGRSLRRSGPGPSAWALPEPAGRVVRRQVRRGYAPQTSRANPERLWTGSAGRGCGHWLRRYKALSIAVRGQQIRRRWSKLREWLRGRGVTSTLRGGCGGNPALAQPEDPGGHPS